MIEWMQTHRKWLVITIWIATIAFIGAGFVGWGQFQFGKKQSTIAKVNDVEVSVQDWQDAYNNLFNQINQQMGGKLDDATAEKMGLKKEALQMAIQQGILRAYAKSLGMYVTEKEIAEKILQYFNDKQTYKKYLAQTGQKAKDFEAKLKKQLLIEKLLNSLNLKAPEALTLAYGSAFYNSDRLNIKILDKKDIKVTLSDDEIKTFWEKNKDKFLTPTKYKIAVVKTPLKGDVTEEEMKKYYEENKNNYKNANGVILSFKEAKDQVKRDILAEKNRKAAILAYKKLKAGKDNFELITVTINNNLIPLNKMNDLIANGYIKPFINNNEYISAKLVEEIKPAPKPFKEAKAEVIKTLMDIKTTQELQKEAQKELKNFKGKDIGFVTKYDPNKIPNLNPMQATEFLFTEFSLFKAKNYILVPAQNPQKAVLYKITEQKLLDKTKYEKNKKQISLLATQTLNAVLVNDLIKDLMAKFNIVTYVK